VENIMSSKLFRTRQGTILLGVVAAVLAAIALIVYLNQYRNNANSKVLASPVLVAQATIAKNTPGADIIASSHLVKPVQVSESKIEAGAITNTSQLQGQYATTDIAAGQQLTTSDFTSVSNPTSLAAGITAGQRAVVIPLDSPGQVGGQIATGDSVDVYALITPDSGAPYVREILQNMYVLNTTSDGNVTLRATPPQAGKLIYASGNDKIWLTLRPARGTVTKPLTITAGTLGG
jgi:Flp pilus assembly protein CpaB